MTKDESVRIAKAIDQIIEYAETIDDFKRDLEWLKINILGSVTSQKNKQKGRMK